MPMNSDNIMTQNCLQILVYCFKDFIIFFYSYDQHSKNWKRNIIVEVNFRESFNRINRSIWIMEHYQFQIWVCANNFLRITVHQFSKKLHMLLYIKYLIFKWFMLFETHPLRYLVLKILKNLINHWNLEKKSLQTMWWLRKANERPPI